MAADNDDVLAENGIFRSKTTNELVCLVCTKDASVVDPRRHIERLGHVGASRSLALAFDKRDSTLVCKKCGVELDWQALEPHAASHSIVPWYEPPSRYKRFFENYFQECDASFYCHLCDAVFPEWSTAWLHIEDDTHVNFVESSTRPSDDGAAFSTIETVYELLVSEAFVPWSSAAVRCRVCHLSDVRLRDIFAHIRAPLHAASHKDFIANLQKRMRNEFLEGRLVESVDTAGDAEPASETTMCIYVVRQSETDYYCKLCEVKLIGRTSVDYHVASDWHTTLMLKHGCEKVTLRASGVYHCECCDATIPDRPDVYNHVRGSDHAAALSRVHEIPTVAEANVATSTTARSPAGAENRNLYANYIAAFPNDDYCCQICNVLLSDIALVEAHLSSRLHEYTSERYGCDLNIVLTNESTFYCLCCDRGIPRLENIFSHTSSNEHKSRLNDAKAIGKIGTVEKASTAPNASWYMEKLNDTEYRCNICVVELPNLGAVDEHISGGKHAIEFDRYGAREIAPRDDAFYCKLCECELATRESVVSHVKRSHAPNSAGKQSDEPRRESKRSSSNDTIGESRNEPSAPKTPPATVEPCANDRREEKTSANCLLPYGGDSHITPMGSNQYWCACCESVIPSLANLFGHTTSQRHKSCAKSSNEATPTFAPNTACMYIVKLNETENHCKICDLVLTGQKAVDEHAAGQRHASGLARDGCRNIRQVSESHYQCKCCSCKIIGLANVYLHVKGTRHRESMLRNEARQEVATSKPVVEDRPIEISNSLLRYGGDRYIKPTNSKEYWCECCKAVIPSLQNIFGHTSSTRHKHSIHGATKNFIPKPDPSSSSAVCRYIARLSETDNHCEVCDLMLSGLTAVKEHAASDRYVAALKRYSCGNIVLGDGIDYYCNSCQCKIPGIANVYLHIKGNRHRDSARYSASSNDNATSSVNVANCRGSTGDPPKNERFADRSARSVASSPARRASSASETRASSLSRNTGDPYVESIGGNRYRCTRCDCAIPSFENIYVHITGAKHKSLVKDSGERPISGPTSFCRYIVKLNETSFSCQICDVALHDRSSVEDHANGESHAKARERYGCETITPNIDNTYYCRSCKCRIPNLANVYVHIKGTRHVGGLSNARFSGKTEPTKSREVSGIAESETTEAANETEVARSSVNRAENYIVSTSVTDFLCQICNISITGLANVDEHLGSNVHAIARTNHGCDNITTGTMGRYNCRCCNCEIPNLENVHRHVKGHRHTLNVSNERKVASSDTSNVNAGTANGIEEKTSREARVGIAKIDENRNGDAKVVAEEADATALSASVSLDSVNVGRSSGNDESYSSDSGRANLPSALGVPKKNSNVERRLRTPRKAISQKNSDFVDYDDARIYELNDMWKDVKIGMEMCLAVGDGHTYCFACREAIEADLSNVFQHLRSAEHCQNLETMVNYHATFDGDGEFSDYDLALQYMEEENEDEIHCYVCAEYVENNETALQKHWLDVEHAQRRRDRQTEAQRAYEDTKSRSTCDWYNVHVYRCEPCGANFFTELGLSRHLKFDNHTSIVKVDRMIYDHCSRCSILWYGTRDTYSASHCLDPTHQFIFVDESVTSPDLPKSAKLLLAWAANFTERMLPTSTKMIARESRKNEIVINDLERAVKSQFPRAKAHIFGSRGCVVNLSNSDIDLFLDSGDMYEGNASSEDRMEFVAHVEKCMREESRTWEIVPLATKFSTIFSVIRAQHRETGLHCNISFENGLCVESANMIGMICRLFPICRNAIVFLKRWMELCDLKDPEGISGYALCWYVIFLMQRDAIIPSIAAIIDTGTKSRTIAGWEVGTNLDFIRYFGVPWNIRTADFVLRFFEYYANFDYRYKVACPLIGDALQKRDFVDPRNLPNSMDTYKEYMKNSNDPEPFRMDSAVCLQDPFDLRRNLTKDAKKAYLSRFRSFCAKSSNLIRGSSIGQCN